MERRKIPSATSTKARQSGVGVIQPATGRGASRLAIENGRATPTRNENDGWMRSCSEQPVHSTWIWWKAANSRRPRPCDRDLAATAARFSTSAIIRNMTSPR